MKLNIAKLTKDVGFCLEEVKGTMVDWNKDLKLFYHKVKNTYYLTDYKSGHSITSAITIKKLQADFDKEIRKYGTHKIKKDSKRVIKISKLIANKPTFAKATAGE